MQKHSRRVVRSQKTRHGCFFSGVFMKERYFSSFEISLFTASCLLIIVSFLAFDRGNYLAFIASLIGVTSLIFNSKGNPVGQALMIVFSILYGIISFSFSYYGEMITYLGMTMPMAVIALVSWLKNPHQKGKSEVAVNTLTKKETAFAFILTALVTLIFYFILSAFHTANIIPSTVSVATSFIAAYLTFRRSCFFALAYAANDIILILLWTLAAKEDISYLSVIICFVVFLVNDLYCFVNWLKMKKRQAQ